jgi:hypothetical protein
MKTLLIILLLACPLFAQQVEYDKFKDQTMVTGEPVRIDRLYMTVRALHKGQTPGADLFAYLVFRSSSRSWMFLKSHGLIFLADGERIDLGDGGHTGDVSSSRYSVGVTERMIYPISHSDLEKIVKATAVELKLGYVEAKLEDKDKKGMREILAYK